MSSCPNCGANIDNQSYCLYCGNNKDSHDYASQIRDTQRKHEIQEIQKEINREKKEIDKLLKDNALNSCVKYGMSTIIVAIVVIATIILFFRDGDGMMYVLTGAIIVIPLGYTFLRFCDKCGNEDLQKEVNKHRRNIKQLTREIEDI